MALARERPRAWPVADRGRPVRRAMPSPADGLRDMTTEPRSRVEVVEGGGLDQARLDGVRLAAREMAHLLNNDLAVAVGLVELLQGRSDLPPRLREVLAE